MVVQEHPSGDITRFVQEGTRLSFLTLACVAKVSLKGGLQHGQTPETLHWDRSKSGDELDAMMRHILDEDWGQVAWRALANLEKQIEKEYKG